MDNLIDKTLLNRLDFISIQANLDQDDDEVLKELQESSNTDMSEYLKLIKRLNTQAKAKLHHYQEQKALSKLNKILENLPNFSSLLSQPRYNQLNVLFSQYKQMTDEDKQSIIEDNLLLDFMNEIDNEE